MTAIQRLVTNANAIVTILKDFFDSTPKNLTLTWVNDDDSIITHTYPNIKKFMNGVNLKNANGEIKDNDGNPVTVNNTLKLNNQTPEEFRAEIEANVDVSKRFKRLVNTERSAPERWMIGENLNGDVLHWGRENHHTSGHYAQDGDRGGFRVVPIPQEKRILGIKIKEIIATTWSVWILFEDGDLYFWGYNGAGQGGIGNTAEQTSPVLSLQNVEKVTTSSHGYYQDQVSVLALKADNTLWGTGKDGYGQLGRGNTSSIRTTWQQCQFTADLTAEDIIIDFWLVDTNVTSAYVLTNTGKVFSSGVGNDGCLGLGDSSNRNIFTRVTGAIANEKVVELACSGGTRNGSSAYYRHSVLARTESNRLFTWGHGGNYELGLGNSNSYNTPQEVTWDNISWGNPTRLLSTRSSWSSYAVLTDKNELHGWGANTYGCLGLGHTNTVSTPTLICTDVKRAWFLGATGTYSYHHILMVLKQDNTLWTTGEDSYRSLGLNESGNKSILTKINFPYGEKIKQVAFSGFSNAKTIFVLLEDGRVYDWGYDGYHVCSVYSTGSTDISTPTLLGI